MHATNYFEAQMLNLLRGQQITAPSHVYLGLFLTDPTDTGTAGEEISYDGYARQQVNFSAPMQSSAGMEMSNANEIGFSECLTDAGTVAYIGLFDDDTGGNMLLYAELVSSLHVTSGIAPVFRIGTVTWKWSGDFSIAAKTGIMNTLRGINMSGITPYVALCNGDISDTGTEFSGGGYARIPVNFSEVEQDPETGDAMIVNTELTLSEIASADWGNFSHIAIFNALTEGVLFASKAISAPFDVKIGMTVGFVAGDLKVAVN